MSGHWLELIAVFVLFTIIFKLAGEQPRDDDP